MTHTLSLPVFASTLTKSSWPPHLHSRHLRIFVGIGLPHFHASAHVFSLPRIPASSSPCSFLPPLGSHSMVLWWSIFLPSSTDQMVPLPPGGPLPPTRCMPGDHGTHTGHVRSLMPSVSLIWAVTGCASHPEAITAPTRGIMVQQSSVINQSSSVLVQQPRLCQPNSDPGFHQQFNACDFPHFVPGSTWRSKENHHLVLYLSPPNYQLPINVSLMTPLGTVRGPRYNEGLMRDLDKRLFWETRGASWEITHPKDSIIAFVQGHHFWDSENLLTQSLGPMCKSRMMELPERLKHPWKL